MNLSNKQISLIRATDFQSGTILVEIILIKKIKFMTKTAALREDNYYQTNKTSFHLELKSLFLKEKKRKSP